MGSGIAHAWLIAGTSVTVVEKDAASARSAQDQISASVAKAVDRDPSVGDASRIMATCKIESDLAALEPVDLVIESVPESVPLKKEVLHDIEKAAPRAVLATNTSAISIDLLARGLERPHRFLGLHFFNPVPSSSLIELVVGAGTDERLVDQVRGWAEGLKKTPIIVRDSPGFASSRLGVLLALEAMRMVEEGVASVEDVDLAMTLGYRHPAGPLRTTDVVGLDVRLAIAENLERELGERFRPPAILRRLVDEGRLGRKTGAGFYDWADS